MVHQSAFNNYSSFSFPCWRKLVGTLRRTRHQRKIDIPRMLCNVRESKRRAVSFGISWIFVLGRALCVWGGKIFIPFPFFSTTCCAPGDSRFQWPVQWRRFSKSPKQYKSQAIISEPLQAPITGRAFALNNGLIKLDDYEAGKRRRAGETSTIRVDDPPWIPFAGFRRPWKGSPFQTTTLSNPGVLGTGLFSFESIVR